MGSQSSGQLVLSEASRQQLSDYEWLMADFKVAASLMDRKDLLNWGASTAGFFVSGVGSRAGNIVRLVGALGSGAGGLVAGGYRESQKGNLWEWVKGGVVDATQKTKQALASGYERSTGIVTSLRENPAQVAPELATTVLMTFLVSGGVDGNGGAPDLDLVMGIDAHRSLFTHSILMGATIETGIRSVLRFVQLVHARLPQERHPWWDSAMAFSNHIGDAAVTGANYGMAYHLFVDGIVQPGAYHGLPIPMPMEAHQAVMTANAVAEAMEPGLRATKSAADPGRAPRSWREEHKALIDTPFALSQTVETMLEPEHAFTVRRYGTWFEALEAGRLAPQTPAQEQFIACSKGVREPETPHELAWFGYKLARQLEG